MLLSLHYIPLSVLYEYWMFDDDFLLSDKKQSQTWLYFSVSKIEI